MTKEQINFVANDDIIKSPNDNRSYRFVTLPNKMKVLLVSDKASETAAVSLNVQVGSLHNPSSQPGLAHYLEHMLFLGTKSYPQANSFNQFLSENSGMLNAYTAAANTNYYFQVVDNKLDESLARFSEFFTAPLFDKSYSKKELSAIDNEWSSNKGSDHYAQMLINNQTSRNGHPVQNFATGNKATLSDKAESVLYQEMKNFYQKYYTANLMSVVIVGKSDLNQLEKLANKHFVEIKNLDLEKPEITQKGLTDKELNLNIYQHTKNDLQQLKLQFAYQANLQDWKNKPEQYVYKLFSSKDKNTLYSYLNKKGLINDFGMSFNNRHYGDNGYLEMSFALTEKGLTHKNEVIAATYAYFDLIKKQGIKESYFNELKQVQKNAFENFQMPSGLQLAMFLSPLLDRVPAQHIIESHYNVGEFSEAKIQNVLGQIDFDKMRVWHIGNEIKANTQLQYADGAYDIKPINAATLTEWKRRASEISLNLPQLNTLISSSAEQQEQAEENLFKPTPVVSKLGAYAWLMHSQHFEQNQGYIELTLNSDLGTTNINEFMKADMLKHLWLEASQAQINKAQQAGIQIKLEAGEARSLKLMVSGPTEQHFSLMDNLFTQLVHLDIKKALFQKKKQAALEWLANQKNRKLLARAKTEMGALLGRLPWRYPEQAKALASITYQDVVEYKNKLLAKNAINIFAFGRYQSDALKIQTNKLLTRLPENRTPVKVHTEAEINLADSQTKLTVSDTDVAIIHQHWLPIKSKEKYAQLVALNALYRPMLFKALRTENEVGYIVASAPLIIDDYPGLVWAIQSNSYSAEQIAEKIKHFNQSFKQSLSKVQASVIDNVKASLIQQLTQPPQNIYQEMSPYLADFNQGNFNFDSKEQLISNLKQVNLADIQQVYSDIFESDKYKLYQVEFTGNKFKPLVKN